MLILFINNPKMLESLENSPIVKKLTKDLVIKNSCLSSNIILGSKIINTPKKNAINDFKDNFLLRTIAIDKSTPIRNKSPKTIAKSEIKARRSPKIKKYLSLANFLE